MLTLTDGKRAAQGSTEPPIPKKRRSHARVIASIALIVVVAAAAVVWLWSRSTAAPRYVTAPVVAGDLTQNVTASGTVNPQDTILVGTQVSGTIQALYVDYNSRVRRGQLLARLDPSTFQAALAQARGALAQVQAQAGSAQANAAGAQFSVAAANQLVVSAAGNVRKAQSDLALAQRTFSRDKYLLARGYIAQSQYDADEAALISAREAVHSAQASVIQNRAQTSQAAAGALGSRGSALAAAAAVQAAQAAVDQAQLNLDRTIISSPVDGTVVARNVSVGQTVAASFQTPTLFTIARDLRKMEVDIAVGEPDIGNVRVGEGIGFSVLAYPNETFRGVVSQVRVNPSTVQNVVTYTVVVLVKNASGKLLPGMTANTSIAVATVRHALIVPLQALSYRPASARPRHSPRPGANAYASGATAASPWGQTGSGAAGAVVAGTRGLVFVLRDGKPQPVALRIDLVSGMQAAVTPLRGVLKAGDEIVVSGTDSRARATASSAAAPGFSRGMIR